MFCELLIDLGMQSCAYCAIETQIMSTETVPNAVLAEAVDAGKVGPPTVPPVVEVGPAIVVSVQTVPATAAGSAVVATLAGASMSVASTPAGPEPEAEITASATEVRWDVVPWPAFLKDCLLGREDSAFCHRVGDCPLLPEHCTWQLGYDHCKGCHRMQAIRSLNSYVYYE